MTDTFVTADKVIKLCFDKSSELIKNVFDVLLERKGRKNVHPQGMLLFINHGK